MELFSENDVRTELKPNVGDVIVCEVFARGWRPCWSDTGKPYGPIRVMDVPLRVNAHHEDCHDDSRGQARFVVEESHPSMSSIDWPNPRQKFIFDPSHLSEHGWVVRARRLRDDGRYDPEGELVEFATYSSSEAQAIIRKTNADALRERWTNPENVARIVETPIRVVGRMTRTVHFE
jgi:hypothetical protein